MGLLLAIGTSGSAPLGGVFSRNYGYALGTRMRQRPCVVASFHASSVMASVRRSGHLDEFQDSIVHEYSMPETSTDFASCADCFNNQEEGGGVLDSVDGCFHFQFH
jgi:hypothetical protein